MLTLVLAIALSQDGGRPPWMEACLDDIVKFCPNPKGKEAVKECLAKHDAELSAKCRDFKAKNK